MVWLNVFCHAGIWIDNGRIVEVEERIRNRSRREFIKTTGLGTAALTLSGLTHSSCSPTRASHGANVLVLFTDDQRFNTIGALNCPEIRTPNIDRLVRSGVSFTRAHIMGGTSGAVCIPSRAMLLTGKTLFHLESQGRSIPEDHTLLPELLKGEGYTTFGTGKWHNGPQAYARCFMQGGPIMFGGMSDHLKVPVHDFDPTGTYPAEKRYTGAKFSSELFTDAVVRFLEDYTNEEPFFAYVSYTAPHDPRMAPDEYRAMYPPEKITLPENYLEEHPFDNGEMSVRDEKLAPWPRTPEIIREHLAAYYAMITHLDAQIGRIVNTLERTGRIQNTVIVFTSDNGLAVGSHGLLGKQNIYDHSVRVPLIIGGPGITGGARSGGLCYLHDIYPTMCDLLGLSVSESVEGRSLVSQLINGDAEGRDSVFLAYRHLQRGVRTDDDWKLIRYNVGSEETTQLFDLNTDPHELHNLADSWEHAEKQESLIRLLKQHMSSLDDFCDLGRTNWGLPLEVREIKEVNHLAVGTTIRLMSPYDERYPGDGPDNLINGIRATTRFRDGHWQGFEGIDFEAVIDLERIQPVRRAGIGFLQNHEPWIFLPRFIEIALSENGSEYHVDKQIGGYSPEDGYQINMVKDYAAFFQNVPARFIRIRAKNIGVCPDWHHGAGGKAWLFTDEIMVE